MSQSPTAPLRVDFPPVANRDDMPMANGRNGWYYSIALSIFPIEAGRDLVRLEPYNSRDVIGRCTVELPLDERVLREVGEKLLQLADYAHAKAKQARPALG